MWENSLEDLCYPEDEQTADSCSYESPNCGPPTHSWTVRGTAQHLGVAKSTVEKWDARWQETGNLNDLARRPRPRVTTAEQDIQIQRAAENNPFTNAVAIRDELELEVTSRTVRRRLHERGIHHRIPATKELLTDQHRAGRLAFARQYADRGLHFWSRVIFTDEKSFCSTNHGRLHMWRRNNTRYDRENVYEEARSGHVTCNVWSWLSLHGVGDLCRIEGRFTAQKYLQILDESFLPSLREKNYPFPAGPIYYVHDRCPIHAARVVLQWFADHDEVQLLDWPSKGADMNPIENVWANVVNTWVPARERTSAELWAHTQADWELLSRKPELVRKHVTSMPDRLREVVEKDGGWTRF